MLKLILYSSSHVCLDFASLLTYRALEQQESFYKTLREKGLHFLSLKRTCYNVCTLAHLESPAPENAYSHKRLNSQKEKIYFN